MGIEAEIVLRELETLRLFCETAGIRFPKGPCFADNLIRTIVLAERETGEFSTNFRFIPGGLTLDDLFVFLYNFDERLGSENRWQLLHGEERKETWRTLKDLEEIPTQAGILVCDFGKLFRFDLKDIAGSQPVCFNSNFKEHTKWAIDCYGSRKLTSAEEALYLFIRGAMEYRVALWSGLTVRCWNGVGKNKTLSVNFRHGDSLGIEIGTIETFARSSNIGAIPRVFFPMMEE